MNKPSRPFSEFIAELEAEGFGESLKKGREEMEELLKQGFNPFDMMINAKHLINED